MLEFVVTQAWLGVGSDNEIPSMRTFSYVGIVWWSVKESLSLVCGLEVDITSSKVVKDKKSIRANEISLSG